MPMVFSDVPIADDLSTVDSARNEIFRYKNVLPQNKYKVDLIDQYDIADKLPKPRQLD